MNTPICDFVGKYSDSKPLRLHMPGHKGFGTLGFESLDITEINGADSLYEASGIISESEDNASSLFGCRTLYSTEGSSQCIRAMLYLAVIHAKNQGKKPIIAAGRNAHKTFLSAAALLDFDIMWLYPQSTESYLSCSIDADYLEKAVVSSEGKPTAVYLTSPDYLGNIADIKSIADVCKKNGILLIVDNAHGAYLKFLPESLHPIDLGADLCCDSAHKTLPVLTGGAYLHIAENAPEFFFEQAKNALSLFGSTSPSYLIMQSLDAANRYISDAYKLRLSQTVSDTENLKKKLIENGYVLYGNEPLKLTISAKEYGYRGFELAEILEEQNIICEFADPDFIVFMITPETESSGLGKLESALISIPRKTKITDAPPLFSRCEKAMSVREAVFSEFETVPVSECSGRILAQASVACPPAVPIVICGEIINENAVSAFEYYGIKECTVIK